MNDTIRFGEFVEVNPQVQLERGQVYPYVEMADVLPGNRFVTPRIKRAYRGGGSRFQSGDILFARITPCLENGKIAQLRYTYGTPCFGSTEFFIFRCIPNLSTSTFVFYMASSRIIRDHAEKNMTGATGRQRTILSALEDIPVPRFPLSTQRKIAAILGNYDDLIENNTRRIKILEEMATTIYREWFVEFRFPGHENVKMVESEMGLIPQGWEVKGLGNLCKVVPGYAFKSKDWQDTGVPVIKIKDIKSDNTVDVHNTDCVSPEILSPKLDKYRLINGDFLIAMTGATAGKVGRLRTKTTMMLNQRVAKLNPIDIYRDYIWCKISLEETQNAFYRLADGAAQPNMSGSQIENYKIVCPPPSICNHFSSMVGNMLLLSDNLMLRNDNLRKTRDLLLPKLISGELNISEMKIDTN